MRLLVRPDLFREKEDVEAEKLLPFNEERLSPTDFQGPSEALLTDQKKADLLSQAYNRLSR
jgi:hypothetical protein